MGVLEAKLVGGFRRFSLNSSECGVGWSSISKNGEKTFWKLVRVEVPNYNVFLMQVTKTKLVLESPRSCLLE